MGMNSLDIIKIFRRYQVSHMLNLVLPAAVFCCVYLLHPQIVNGGSLDHNSTNLGTKYGTWGTAYSCSTCHGGGSANIKLINMSIATPIGTRPVVFDAISGSGSTAAVMGNDLRTAYQNGSRNICEVCHHQTSVHNYSASKVGADKNHMNSNNKDCTDCHSHQGGFKANFGPCDSCHGYQAGTWGVKPIINAGGVGAHEKHIAYLTAKRYFITLSPNTDLYGSAAASWTKVCGACHAGGSHANSSVEVFATNSPAYLFGTSGATSYQGISGVLNSVTAKTCSNVSCHYFLTPSW